MIVVTGPGRSGTTFLAELYRNLGFDPGGGWQEGIRAGREQKEVVDLNNQMSDAMNMRRVARPVEDAPPTAQLGGAAQAAPPFGSERWDLVPELADRFGSQMRTLAEKYAIAKDPRFCWTLRLWLMAGAKIDHVVVTLRRIDDIVQSITDAGMARPEEQQDVNMLRSATMFRFGMLLSTFGEFDVPHTVLWFPQCTEDAEALHAALPTPEPVKLWRFKRALRKTLRPDYIHHGHGNPAPADHVRVEAPR